MRKFKNVVLFSLMAVLALSGCNNKKKADNSAVSSEYKEPPSGAISFTDDIDWEQAMDGAREILDVNDYPLGDNLDYVVDDSSKTITLIWALKDEATSDDAIAYAKAYIKAFNDSTNMQRFSIEVSSDDSFGGLWKDYALNIQVYRKSDILTEANYFIKQSILANQPIEIVLQQN